MANVSLTSPLEIQIRGLQALKEVLGPVDMARFLQQYDSGHGDYTKEKVKRESRCEIAVISYRDFFVFHNREIFWCLRSC